MPPQAGALIRGQGELQHKLGSRPGRLIRQALHQQDGGFVRHRGSGHRGTGCTLAVAGVPLCDHRYQSGAATAGSMRP